MKTLTIKELKKQKPAYKALICGRWRNCWELDGFYVYVYEGKIYQERM